MAEAWSALSGAFRQDLLVPGHRAELEGLLRESIISHKVWDEMLVLHAAYIRDVGSVVSH